jgi:hypothetical protein
MAEPVFHVPMPADLAREFADLHFPVSLDLAAGDRMTLIAARDAVELAITQGILWHPEPSGVPPQLEPVTLVGGQRINAHRVDACTPPCPIHAPSSHHMATWPQNWRDDRGIIERICEHGVGHPDPDDRNEDTVHGCDGCCRAVVDTPEASDG